MVLLLATKQSEVIRKCPVTYIPHTKRNDGFCLMITQKAKVYTHILVSKKRESLRATNKEEIEKARKRNVKSCVGESLVDNGQCQT